MKKLSAILSLTLIFSLCLCSLASAAIITPIPPEINPEHLEKTACYARILGFNANGNTLTVELIGSEVFDYSEVEALKEGDIIYTNGQEVVIETMVWNNWGEILCINEGDVYLIRDLDGNFQTDNEDDSVWNVIARLECPVKDHLLFLDYIDDATGDILSLPIVLTANELATKLLTEQASDNYHIGFSANNVYVIFDGEGDLAVIHRFYVPWQ